MSSSVKKYLVAEFNLKVRFFALSRAENVKPEVSFYVDKESEFAGLVATVKKALEEGTSFLEAKKMLEDGGLITIYKEIPVLEGTWQPNIRRGWNYYYIYGGGNYNKDGRNPDPVKNVRCHRCNLDAGFYPTFEHEGLIRCYNCHFHDVWEMDWSRFHPEIDPKAKILRWPEDAYYQWDIRGTLLWAYNREHAQATLDFIASKERREEDFPNFCKSLQKLPAEIVSAKVRDLVVRRISQTLQFSQNKITP